MRLTGLLLLGVGSASLRSVAPQAAADSIDACRLELSSVYSGWFKDFSRVLLLKGDLLEDCVADVESCWVMQPGATSDYIGRLSRLLVEALTVPFVVFCVALIWGFAIWCHNVCFCCCRPCRACCSKSCRGSCCSDRERVPSWRVRGVKVCALTALATLWCLLVAYLVVVQSYFSFAYSYLERCPDKTYVAGVLSSFALPPGPSSISSEPEYDTFVQTVHAIVNKLEPGAKLWTYLSTYRLPVLITSCVVTAVIGVLWVLGLATGFSALFTTKTADLSLRRVADLNGAFSVLWFLVAVLGWLALLVGAVGVMALSAGFWLTYQLDQEGAAYFEHAATSFAEWVAGRGLSPEEIEECMGFLLQSQMAVAFTKQESFTMPVAVLGDYGVLVWTLVFFGITSMLGHVLFFKQWHYWSNIFTELKLNVSAKRLEDEYLSAVIEGRLDTLQRLQRIHPTLEVAEALHHAAFYNHVDIAKNLLKRGASVDERSAGGYTAFQIAAMEGHMSIARVLLSWGAASTIRDEHGDTVLHAVTRAGKPDDVRYLVEKCCMDVDLQDNDRRTAAEVAEMFGNSNAHTSCQEVLAHPNDEVVRQSMLKMQAALAKRPIKSV